MVRSGGNVKGGLRPKAELWSVCKTESRAGVGKAYGVMRRVGRGGVRPRAEPRLYSRCLVTQFYSYAGTGTVAEIISCIS